MSNNNMDVIDIFSLETCHKERMDFFDCMKKNINSTFTIEKKEKKCKKIFDNYITCMKEKNEKGFTFKN